MFVRKIESKDKRYLSMTCNTTLTHIKLVVNLQSQNMKIFNIDS